MVDQILPSGERAVTWQRLAQVPDLAALARALDDNTHPCLLFDSAEGHASVGRFSYLCVRPVWEVTAWRDRAELRLGDGEVRKLSQNGPELLHELLEATARSSPPDAPVPFTGGLAGFLSYELHELFEPASAATRAASTQPDFTLARVDWLVAADQVTGTAWLVANGFAADEQQARRDADQLLAVGAEMVAPYLKPRQARKSARPSGPIEPGALGLQTATSRAEYLTQVHEIQQRIVAGDVYEVCLSQRFEGPGNDDPHELYKALISENPAPMSALLRLGGLDIVSASFERFLRIDSAGHIETRPVKGTRPRSPDPSEDARLKSELAASVKDRAENVMAVDVARNDLGRVCDYGSVEVTDLCSVESYTVTHQLVSTVRGRLFDQMAAFDAIKAAFPGASMTGAPKIQAMLTIAELEPVPRGVFAGSLLWAGYDGQLDASIVIRTFVRQGERLSLHVGGAVIADSVPQDEYEETLHKAQGMLHALAVSRAG